MAFAKAIRLEGASLLPAHLHHSGLAKMELSVTALSFDSLLGSSDFNLDLGSQPESPLSLAMLASGCSEGMRS